MQVGNSLDMLEDREPDINAQSVELQSIADDKNAPENIRADAGLVLLQIASVKFDKERGEDSARALGAAVEKFLETHPDDARAPMLRLTEAQALEAFDQERARRIYEETAKNDNNTTKKVPVLGDLPIVGQFFRSEAKNRTTSELLIFVTPTIIEDDTTG
jgi:hypothetical protein